MKLDKLFICFINQKKLLKRYSIIKLNQCKHQVDPIFMNAENIRTSKPHVFIFYYYSIIKLNQCKYKVDPIFMDAENSRISKLHALILNHTDKVYVQRREKNIALSSLSIYYTYKNIKGHIQNQ